ncbi:MAG: deoxyribodipyrimidine photo-lyase [Akkermansiaceae bacterium]|nr:deoxyribodipyrimidine photo-lyase [Armatimonadota bacterium]
MQSAHKTALVWFRRGVRVRDNHALTEAVKSAETVVPVFVLDPTILTHQTTAPVRARFLFESLRSLDDELRKIGGRLIIRHGKPLEELERLVHETGATALFFGREYEPYGRERDKTISAAMKERGVTVTETDDHLLTEPGEVMTKAGTVYTVFTPYKRVWFEQAMDAPLPAPKRIVLPDNLHSEAIPELPASVGVSEAYGGEAPGVLVKGGEMEGAKWLDKFVEACLGDYGTERDYPAHEGTSRLSAYLRSGVISPRQIFDAVRTRRDALSASIAVSANTFLSELAWRDFYYQILFHFPHVQGGAFKPVYDGISWENDDALFAAWRDGKTGYPIIDAASRQMNAQGWMHNRARMISASFLCKDLLCDWRRGEEVFMQRLVDGDQASNNGGWQWAAGTGTDAQPFFRIFNPTSQGEKFDADGSYVKQWCPELKRIPAKYVHKPWELSEREQEAVGCVLGRDYPRPIVDHKVQRERALALYRATPATDEAAGKPAGETSYVP